MRKPDVTIIGTGAVGSVLAQALHEHGMRVKSIYNRTPEKMQKLIKLLETSISGVFPDSGEDLGTLVFLCVKDGDIEEVSIKISGLQDNFQDITFVHCSGTKSSEALDSLKKKGATVAAFNPLQTFTEKSSPKDFNGISFGLEGDPYAKDLLRKIASTLGASCIELSPAGKPYVHAAAVMASNYFLALMQSAEDIAGLGDSNPAAIRKALLPLVKKSLQNAAADDLSTVLSGPIPRGDIETIRKHLELLQADPQLTRLYKQLGMQMLKLAIKSGKLSDEQASEIRCMFAYED